MTSLASAMNILALWHGAYSTWNFSDWAVLIVILGAIIGLVLIAIKQFGLTIPSWAIQVFWLVVAAVVIIVAIRFVASL